MSAPPPFVAEHPRRSMIPPARARLLIAVACGIDSCQSAL